MSTRALVVIGLIAVLMLGGGAALAAEETMQQPAIDDEYPDLTEFIQAAAYRSGGAGRTVDTIVIHITDGAGDARATAEYFASGAEGRGVSAHYVVSRAGDVFQCVRDRDIAFHAHSANASSIGIENSARTRGENGADDPGLEVTEENYRATARLCHWLCRKFELEPSRRTIVGHNEADSQTTHTRCPTGQWEWSRFMQIMDEEA